MKNFNVCLQKVLADEGGYTNDPSDNGGATNFGITLKDYRLYINKNGTPKDVKNMTVDQAKVIYKTKYWDALNCDKLPAGVDYTVFDYGVNSGLGRPRKALDAFKSLTGDKLIDAINDERMAFLMAISDPSNPKYEHNYKFRNGWTKRVSRVRSFSHYLAAQKTDKVSGPASATVATGVMTFSLWSHIVAHPYLTVAGIAVITLAVGGLIHYMRNK